MPLADLPPEMRHRAEIARAEALKPPEVTYSLDLDIGEVADGHHLIVRSIALKGNSLLFEHAFVPEVPDPEKLELTIARIANVVGENNVGSPQLVDSHRPDSFRMQRFSVPSTPSPTLETKSETKIAFRAYRPPVLAKIKLRGARPIRADFLGRSGDVIHASGPWRTSGDWWEDDPWQQDAWDLELAFPYETPPAQGLYRICFDSRQKKWFVQGAYD